MHETNLLRLIVINGSTWRAMNSFGLRWGFVMPTVDKVNPLERFFIVLQNFFPLNYIVWFLLAGFLICCARSSVHHSSSRLTCFKVGTFPTLKLTIALKSSPGPIILLQLNGFPSHRKDYF